MGLWLQDARFHFGMALRGVGSGIVALAWTSVFATAAGFSGEQRTYVLMGICVAVTLVAHGFGGLPPSFTLVGLLRSLEKDLVAAARERSGGDPRAFQELVARIAAHAAARVGQGVDVPGDRRAWFRLLAQKLTRTG